MSAIEEMAKRAEREIHPRLVWTLHAKEMTAAIIARHYREGVRELVLAARATCRNRWIYSNTPESERLRKALEDYADIK